MRAGRADCFASSRHHELFVGFLLGLVICDEDFGALAQELQGKTRTTNAYDQKHDS